MGGQDEASQSAHSRPSRAASGGAVAKGRPPPPRSSNAAPASCSMPLARPGRLRPARPPPPPYRNARGLLALPLQHHWSRQLHSAWPGGQTEGLCARRRNYPVHSRVLQRCVQLPRRAHPHLRAAGGREGRGICRTEGATFNPPLAGQGLLASASYAGGPKGTAGRRTGAQRGSQDQGDPLVYELEWTCARQLVLFLRTPPHLHGPSKAEQEHYAERPPDQPDHSYILVWRKWRGKYKACKAAAEYVPPT